VSSRLGPRSATNARKARLVSGLRWLLEGPLIRGSRIDPWAPELQNRSGTAQSVGSLPKCTWAVDTVLLPTVANQTGADRVRSVGEESTWTKCLRPLGNSAVPGGIREALRPGATPHERACVRRRADLGRYSDTRGDLSQGERANPWTSQRARPDSNGGPAGSKLSGLRVPHHPTPSKSWNGGCFRRRLVQPVED
jgi:hypothetical protein